MPHDDLVGLVPAPELRCGHVVGPWTHSVCGANATRIGLDVRTGFIGFFCNQHGGSAVTPVPDPVTIRLVEVDCSVVLAGVSLDRTHAQREAEGQLRRIAAVVGGRLEINAVRSAHARYYPSARAVGRAGGDGG